MYIIKKIIHAFGGKFLLLNLFFLIISFLFISSYIKNKLIRLTLSIVFSLITVLQICSLYIIKSFINYSFIIHFNTRDITAMMSLFTYRIVLCVFAFIVFTVIFYHSSLIISKVITLINRYIPFTKKMLKPSVIKLSKIIILIAAVCAMLMPNGVLQKSYTLVTTLQVDEKPFKEHLESLKMKDYVLPEDLKVSSTGKNIIIISLESFEKGYLSEKHASLTPFLISLKKDSTWQYYDIQENEGSKWTSGSLYTFLTGFPAYFGTMHNNIFQSSYHSNIIGIGHILKKEEYTTTYIGSDAKVSGTQDMLYALKFDEIIDKATLGAESQDKDLFNKAKEKILESSKSKKPFSVIISTLSTHFPNGVYDNRMEKHISAKNSDLEFMVAATDYLLQDFIGYLKEIKVYDNTVIYIFPDHLKMGDDSLFEGTGARGLFVLTNAKNKVIETKDNDTLYQIDLPEIILNGADITTNATFLTDYIVGDKNQFIQDHISEITALNVAGFNRTELKPFIIPKITKHFEAYKTDTLRYIAHAGGKIDEYTYTNSLEALNSNYKKGFRLFELDIQKTSDNKYVALHYWEDWPKMSSYDKPEPVSHKEFMSQKLYGKYTPLDMDAINTWFKQHPDAILVTDKVNDPDEFIPQFIDKNRLMMELFSWEAVKKASSYNIKSVIPSQNVLFNLGGINAIDSFKKYNIEHVAISRNIIAANMALLNVLKENNIKVYAYNVTDFIDRDEMYVVKHEMDYIYGIYADEWNFD